MLENFSYLLELASKIVLPIVAYCLSHGLVILTGIRKELRTLNGRLIKLEEWRSMHDKIDEMRFDALNDDIHALTLKVDTKYRR